MNKLLPLYFNLQGKTILMVGAGRVALEKLEKLLATETSVVILAPEIIDEIRALAKEHPDRITLTKRKYEVGDAIGYPLVISATNSSEINEYIVKDCRDRNIIVNAVDDPKHCDFLFSSQIFYGPLQVSISSAGQLPGLAKCLREIFEAILPKEHLPDLERLIAFRRDLKKVIPDTKERTKVFRRLLDTWEEEYINKKDILRAANQKKRFALSPLLKNFIAKKIINPTEKRI